MTISKTKKLGAILALAIAVAAPVMAAVPASAEPFRYETQMRGHDNYEPVRYDHYRYDYPRYDHRGEMGYRDLRWRELRFERHHAFDRHEMSRHQFER